MSKPASTTSATFPADHRDEPTRVDRSLRVAVVDEELPYPANSGKRIRTLNLLLQLARRHRITYLCHRNADPDEASAAEHFFREHDITTIVVDRAVPRQQGLGFYGRLAANLLSPHPYSVQVHASHALQKAIRDHDAAHQVDLWHCEWTPYAQSLDQNVHAPWVVTAHNVESLIWQRYHETESNPLKRWYIKRQWAKFERFERRVFASATRTIAVSEADAALARDRFRADRVSVVDNGVDAAYFRPDGAPRDANTVLFLGSLDWRPNLDAARLLVETVFPAVRAARPDARLCLVGRNPPRWLIEAARGDGSIELHADVPDVRPFLARAALMAVPLRIGGGSRLKILESLAAECPVVSTRVGAEGLNLTPGKHFVQVDTIDAMAGAIVACLDDPRASAEAARRGRAIVAARYDWSFLADRLEAVWLAAAENPQEALGLPPGCQTPRP